MAIDLRITADTPEELISTINGLASLGSGRVVHRPAEPFVQPDEAAEEAPADPQPQADETPRPTGRKPRQPKAEPAPKATDPSAGEQSSGQAASAGAGQTADPPATSAKSVGDVFSDQIQQAVTEAAAERALEAAAQPQPAPAPATPAAPQGEITMETINATFAPMIGAGKKFPSMREAQEFLKANFKNAENQPARGMREVQPADYARLMQLLQQP